jgi:hypothetical protein
MLAKCAWLRCVLLAARQCSSCVLRAAHQCSSHVVAQRWAFAPAWLAPPLEPSFDRCGSLGSVTSALPPPISRCCALRQDYLLVEEAIAPAFLKELTGTLKGFYGEDPKVCVPPPLSPLLRFPARAHALCARSPPPLTPCLRGVRPPSSGCCQPLPPSAHLVHPLPSLIPLGARPVIAPRPRKTTRAS